MPFKGTRVLDEMVGFVAAYLEGEETMAGLCRAYGISRQWGYELVRRYQVEGPAGLVPRSRAPHHPEQPHRPHLEAQLLAHLPAEAFG
jgi:transposase-like protein